MRYRYYTCDVFAEARFGGNPLAVLPQAQGLSGARMQRIAREFNLSETSFVFPPEAGHTRRVRIFTPGREVPFAGHPNVGTAFVLATTGEFGNLSAPLTVTFEEKAGLVPVAVDVAGGRVRSCELQAPEKLSLGKTIPVPLLAAAVSLDEADVVTDTHLPQEASVGLPFLVTEVRDRSVLERVRVNGAALEPIHEAGVRPSLYLYARTGEGEIQARMFAPLSGVPEDPATGSAGCAVAGLLAHHEKRASGDFPWRISQGIEMGRPSVLRARARKEGGRVRDTWIAGASVFVSEGTIEVA